jgi:hypothetical protein
VAGLWQAHWIYWFAPITGMMVAARVYEFLRQAELRHYLWRGPPWVFRDPYRKNCGGDEL